MIVSVVLLIVVVFSVRQVFYLRRLLHQITEFSRALARGEIEKRLYMKNAGAFTEIAENLTAMSDKLHEMIDKNEEEKKRLSEILRSVPDALLIIDAKGVIQLASSSAREFFGEVEFAGRQFMEAVRSYELSELMDAARRTLSPGAGEVRLDHPAEKHLLVRVSLLFQKDGEVSGFIIIFHDITELKRVDQIRKDFVANVSHEIKTPITAIRGFADTLLEGALDERANAVRFIQRIKANSERMNSLADDLMTISKVELGVTRMERTEVDVKDVIENVIENLKEKADAKSLSLITSFGPGAAKVLADRNKLIQILTNLVDNAIKFTETGSVTIGVYEEEGRQYLFVKDTGMGIPSKHLPRLGERFYRVDPARSRKLGGTGLGLAIVKHLVKAHAWDMKIESAEGEGTTVKICLG